MTTVIYKNRRRPAEIIGLPQPGIHYADWVVQQLEALR